MYYDTCRKYEGKVVKIRDKHGQLHVGKITKVERDRVWIEPTSSDRDGRKGEKECSRKDKKRREHKNSHRRERDDFFNNSFFYNGDGGYDNNGKKRRRRRKKRDCGGDVCAYDGGYGRGGGWGWGWGGYPIAFGFITGIALAALFFF
ncbi:hypothetical protein [Priestia taiwanensis]|uniref:Uncharacterized protein n=1 Tax=Priestia taiwanensis TaxID=1347902 RepID=A0A917EPD1_9BACI|nr:hypothetical protein [Priestia taiwanensis]MBM7362461.1 hypothetical protein [Priestia taiwanensis]GGE62376.1 hypothetical protein GCM10007140_10840 [Priestia taiwanensis]